MARRVSGVAIAVATLAIVTGQSALATSHQGLRDVASHSTVSTTAPALPLSYVLTKSARTALPSQAHSAFPGAARLADGTLLAIWRQGSGHLTFDGRLFSSTSADNGRTWTPERLSLYATGFDLRDPALAVIGGQVWMTLCTSEAPDQYGNGVYVTHSSDGATWSTPVRVDAGLPRAGESGPVVKLADGRLLQAFYGHPAGETRDSMYAATSSDGGASWESERVLNGQADGRDYVEPWTMVTAGGQVRAFLRWGATAQIGTVDFDGKVWVNARPLWNGSGRPACVPNGHRVLCVYRDADPTHRVALMRLSSDDGATFGPARLFDGSGYLFTYAQPVATGRGWVVTYAVQTSGTSTAQGASAIFVRTVGPSRNVTNGGASVGRATRAF